MGDLVVYSFNPTKILECGGAALVVRSITLLERLSIVLEEPLPRSEPPERAGQLSLSYRNLHHGLVGLLRLHRTAECSETFKKLRPYYQGLPVRSMTSEESLAAQWPLLPEKLAHRDALAETYTAALRNGPWKLLTGWSTSGVCWRFTLLLEEENDLVRLSEAVRRDGYHVSNLYWPVNHFFLARDSCVQADRFARRVVNLWVDDSTSEEQVIGCCKSLWRQAETSGTPRRKIP